MRTALIAGASGLVGGFLLRQLLDAPEYDRVVSLGRRTIAWAHPKLVQVVVEFAALEKVTADLSCADAFCCLGTTIKQAGSREAFRAVDHAAVLAFAWAARRHGAERFFLVSALGAHSQSRVFYNRVKGETEEALAVIDFPTLAIFRPSLLLGRKEKTRLGERVGEVVMWVAEPLLLGRLRKYRAIQAEVVARAMARIALSEANQGVAVFLSDQIQELGEYGKS